MEGIEVISIKCPNLARTYNTALHQSARVRVVDVLIKLKNGDPVAIICPEYENKVCLAISYEKKKEYFHVFIVKIGNL